MKKLTILITAAVMSFSAAKAQTSVPVKYAKSSATDDILTEVPATAKDSLFLQDTYIMSGYGMQHYTWSGHFYHIAFDENGKDVYFKNLCSEYVFDTYVKGEIDGNTIKIPTGQHVFHQDADYDNGLEEADLYLSSAKINEDGTEVVVDNESQYILFDIGEDGVLRSRDGYGAAYVDPTGYLLAKNYTYQFEPFDTLKAIVNVPADAEIIKYDMEYLTATEGSKMTKTADVIINGDEVFVKGLSQYNEGWVKGVVDGDSVRFKSHQYLGRYSNSENLENDFAVFFNGAYDTGEWDVMGRVYATIPDIAFKYDKETSSLVSAKCVTETIGEKNPYSHMVEPKLTPSETGGVFLPATPAAPSITSYRNYVFTYRMTVKVPSYDTDGKPLDTERLTYRFYMDGEPFTFSTSEYNYIDEEMAEVPYNYLDGNGYGSDIMKGADDERIITLYREFSKIAVESVYTVDGVTNVSDKYEYDVKTQTGGTTTGIQDVDKNSNVKPVIYTDMTGRITSNPGKGIFIRTEVMDNGSRKSVKIMK